jgi:hypothetical protein
MKKNSVKIFWYANLLLNFPFQGLYPSGWHADWTLNGGIYRLYTDQEIQTCLQEATNLQRNINAITTAGNHVERIAHLVDKLAYHAPRSIDVLKRCAKIEMDLGNWHRAEGFLRCAIQIDPKEEEARKWVCGLCWAERSDKNIHFRYTFEHENPLTFLLVKYFFLEKYINRWHFWILDKLNI